MEGGLPFPLRQIWGKKTRSTSLLAGEGTERQKCHTLIPRSEFFHDKCYERIHTFAGRKMEGFCSEQSDIAAYERNVEEGGRWMLVREGEEGALSHNLLHRTRLKYDSP